MTQISRQYIKPEILVKILDIFLVSITAIHDKKTASTFMEEFLTPTEKIMLAKRLASFYLLIKDVPQRYIADLLKLSTASVTKYSLFLKRNPTIEHILKKILRNDQFSRILETFFMEYLMPPLRPGSNWKANLKNYNDYKRNKESPF